MRIILLLFFLFFNTDVFASSYLVHTFRTETSTSSLTVSFPSNNRGNLIIAVAAIGANQTSSTPTDTVGNTYTLITSKTFVSSGFTQTIYMWYAQDIRGTNTTNTVTFSLSGSNYARGMVLEYGGLDKSSPLITSNNASGSGTSLNAGALTTTPGDFLIGWFFNNTGTITVTNSDFISRTSPSFSRLTDGLAINTSSTISATASSATWAGVSAAFVNLPQGTELKDTKITNGKLQ